MCRRMCVFAELKRSKNWIEQLGLYLHLKKVTLSIKARKKNFFFVCLLL